MNDERAAAVAAGSLDRALNRRINPEKNGC